MKNIILFSDGTGNSGGVCNSNVYRKFEALDLDAKEVMEVTGVDADGKKKWEKVKDFKGQVAVYDDGVGTQENKLIRAISGGTGVGLRKNVVQLYAALLHQFEPGDRIFLFGFSRGAFTVRVFANLLFHCGIADAYEGGEGKTYEERLEQSKSDKLPMKSPTEINELAESAVDAYAYRTFCDPFQEKPQMDPMRRIVATVKRPFVGKPKSPKSFRDRKGLKSERNVEGERGWFPLHFVGVWDTVEAYGLPIDEMSDSFIWLFPLRFKRQGRFLENDLHPLIDNAFHALAIDDERHSFHPKMWIESEPLEPIPPGEESRIKQPIQGGKAKVIYGSLDGTYSAGIRKVKANEKQRVEQVWFAGMHSNVGGSYPKDQLAHVASNWMIEKAEECGLKIEELAKQRLKDADDPAGKMYDSRSGFSIVYRYRPRDLSVLSAEAGLQKPQIHCSVLQRIHRHTDDYAPTGIPKEYEVVYPQPNKYVVADDGKPTTVEPDKSLDPRKLIDSFEEKPSDQYYRASEQQTYVDFLIWRRRILYVVFIVGLLTLLLTAWNLQPQPSDKFDIEQWNRVSRFLYYLLAPVVDIVIWVVPSYVEPSVVGLGRHPWLLVGFAVGALLILRRSSALKSVIVQKSNEAWAKGLGKTEPEPSGTWAQLKAFLILLPKLLLMKKANDFRQNPTLNNFASWFHRWMLPKLLLVGVVCAIAFTLWNWLAPPVLMSNKAEDLARPKKLEKPENRMEFGFKTNNPFYAAPVRIEAGQLYHISVVEDTKAPWKDKDLAANASGLVDDPSRSQQLFPFAKRVNDRPWFELIASIGPEEDELIPIGEEKTFMPKTSGRLYLFVNDAHGAYGNNQGEATITVKKLNLGALKTSTK